MRCTGLLFLVGIAWGAIAADIDHRRDRRRGRSGRRHRHRDDAALRRRFVRIGLYGFNGILVGAALPTFLDGGVMLWVYIVIGAAVSTVAIMAIANVFKTWGVPALTFPFILTTGSSSSRHSSSCRSRRRTSARASFPQHHRRRVRLMPTSPFSFLWDTLFRNVSQIFLINNIVTGIIFVIALRSRRAGRRCSRSSVPR